MKWQDNLRDYALTNGKELSISQQLKNKEFKEIKRALSVFRANWKGGSKQVFELPFNARACVDHLLSLDSMPKANPFSYHPTPTEVNDVIYKYTGASPDFWRSLGRPVQILEPSAGEGSLCDSVASAFAKAGIEYEITAIELDPINCLSLNEKGYSPIQCDFLTFEPNRKFDLIVANPPFEGLNFIKHIRHAQTMLTHEGYLVSVIPTQPLKKQKDKKAVKKLIEDAALTLDDTFTFEPGVFVTAKTTETRIIELRSEQKLESFVTPNLKKFIQEHQFNLTVLNDGDLLSNLKQIDWSGDKFDVYHKLKEKLQAVTNQLVECYNIYLPEEWHLDFCLDIYEILLPKMLADQNEQKRLENNTELPIKSSTTQTQEDNSFGEVSNKIKQITNTLHKIDESLNFSTPTKVDINEERDFTEEMTPNELVSNNIPTFKYRF